MTLADFPLRVKICGVTNREDALAAADAGATAIGVNFFPGSKRFVSIQQAREIVAAVPADVLPVGVFVNAELADIQRSVEEANLRGIQLHGTEPNEFVDSVGEYAVANGLTLINVLAVNQVNEHDLPRAADVVLLDSAVGAGAGQGGKADWKKAQSLVCAMRLPHENNEQHSSGKKVVLAGGLTSDNVAEAITLVRPDGVDVASGVELAAGKKDARRMAAFIGAAIAAFDR